MFLSGVIEGFYGRAWNAAQRVEMLDWIAEAGMNCFVYGPKDDIKVRARWRELYTAGELAALRQLAEAAAARNIVFMVAIAPCLDIVHSDPAEQATLNRRIDQLLDIGVTAFALLFDDIPSQMLAADAAVFPSIADAQCHVTNAAFAHMRERAPDARMIFCPTEYCAAFAKRDVPGSAYLNTIGAQLHPEIGVFWTGPDIVSETISAASLREVGAVLRRKPVIWENFHANDYDIRRVYAGALGGRSDDILPLIDGFITNPNNEFEANFVPVRTTGAFVAGGYDEAAANEAAIVAWQSRFKLAYANSDMDLEQIRLLVGLLYQPFTCGPEIEGILATARGLLAQERPEVSSAEWQSGHAALTDLRDRIRDLFDTSTELENRDLFYAFQPYLWEAREEVTHLVTYLDWLAESPAEGDAFPEKERVYNFYRRGFGVAMQEILPRTGGRLGHRR